MEANERAEYEKTSQGIRAMDDWDPYKIVLARRYHNEIYSNFTSEKFANEYALKHFADAIKKVRSALGYTEQELLELSIKWIKSLSKVANEYLGIARTLLNRTRRVQHSFFKGRKCVSVKPPYDLHLWGLWKYSACFWMTDEAFRDAIGDTVDVFLGEAPAADIFWFFAGHPGRCPAVSLRGGFDAYTATIKVTGRYIHYGSEWH